MWILLLVNFWASNLFLHQSLDIPQVQNCQGDKDLSRTLFQDDKKVCNQCIILNQALPSFLTLGNRIEKLLLGLGEFVENVLVNFKGGLFQNSNYRVFQLKV